MVEELLERVGDEVSEGEPLKCTGLRATGGGRLDVELVVEVESRRSWVVELFGGGRTAFVSGGGVVPLKEVWEKFLADGSTPEGLYGGGSLRVPFVVLREFGDRDAVVEACEGPLGGMVGTRGTVTQSGSSLYVYGFEGRLGFGTAPLCGGSSSDLAKLLLSNHHFLLSELAGGRPDSIASYPIKSSSSVSSSGEFAVVDPTMPRLLS